MNFDMVRAIPTPYMLIGIAALVLASMGFGWMKGAHHEALKAAKFEAATEALGKAQAQRSKEINAHNLQLKQEADNENKRTTAALLADIKRLRNARASGSFVPGSASAPASPDRATFDRAELEQSIRDFDTGVQGLVDQGSQAVIDLDSAKRWAQKK